MSLPEITPRAFFGLRVNIKQNAHYITDFRILYPAGSVLVLHNYYEHRQEFIELYDKSLTLEVIIVSPSRKLAAIIENGERGQILIFDMHTLKRKRTLNLPPDATTTRFESICFSFDDKYIMAITGDPDWMLVAYNWEKGKIETTAKANYTNNPAIVTQVYCSPTDNCEVCLIGPGLFRLLNMSETVWRQYGFQKADQLIVTTAAWLTSDRVLCGTADGKLILIEAGELKAVYNAWTVFLMNVKDKDESTSATSLNIVRNSLDNDEEDRQVRTLISFSKGFAYSCGTGLVHMFEKDSPYKYRKRNVFRIDDPDFRESEIELNQVRHLSINVTEDKLLATTNREQLYSVRLWGPDLYVAPEISFKHLGQPLHHGIINGLATCVWKPIFMTCGQMDRTVRVWNYDTETLEMMKQYQEDVFSVALHPTGLFATIGFAEKLRFMIILLDDIQMCREFNIRECRLSSFSSHGHYFAAVNHSMIQIFSCVSFQNVWNLKGHTGKVTALKWTLEDKKLVSCGSDGAIYEWDIITGKKMNEIITHGVSYWDCSVTSDGKFIYVVGDDGFLKEINGSRIIRSVQLNQSNMDHIVVSRSDLMMFVCGDGGAVLSVKMPLTDPAEFLPFFYHNSKITQMKLSFNDETLITVSEGGSLVIWKILYAEGKTIVMDKDFNYSNEILISKTELEEKISAIRDLSQKLYELEMDHASQMRDTESSYSEKIKDIHDTYCQAIEELKEKTEQLEIDYFSQLTTINEEVSEMKEKQEIEKKEMDANYTSKLLVEYDKFKILDEQKEEMVKDYEIKLAELQQSKDEATQNINKIYEEKLMDINQKLEASYQQNTKNIKWHETIKQQVEDDTDREIVETRAKYENELREERENNVKLRAEASNMRKKYLAAQKDIDEFRQQILLLQTEHQKYQTIIQTLEKDIVDLKREIIERDLTVQDKDKRVYDLKKKIQELEKYKFVLDYKIKELKNQIEPKDREIKEKKEQIEDMEKELENLQKINTSLELQLVELKEKINATEKEVESYEEKFLSGSNVLRQIKVDVYTLYHQISDFKKLKDGIKLMYHKYNEDQIFIRGQSTDTDLQREFMTQREFLEKTISALKSTLEKSKENIKHDGTKVLQDNVILLEELNQARKTYKETVRKVRNLEELLEFKPGKTITPREAYNKLQQSLKKQENIVQEYQSVIEKANLATTFLTNEAVKLQDKVITLEEKEALDNENKF